MKFAFRFAGLALAALLFAPALTGYPTAQANEAVIRKALTQQFPGASIISVKPTPYSGLFEVYLDDQLVYTDAKAQYIFDGNVIDLKTRTNLTQARLNQLQAIKWDSLPFANAIKTVKGTGARKLVVFSDVDCPYCRKFETELDKVDNITVYTFLYPIEGLHPKAVQMSKQIWCAPDRNKAWNDYITNKTVPNNDGKCSNPVDATIALGAKLKVSGTPTLFFTNGQRVPGMVPAAQLEKLLADSGAK
jgi:thiol:disulfide interchange protein DsbC